MRATTAVTSPSGETVRADQLGNCLVQSAIADATGTVSTYLKVEKVFPGVDCGVNPPGCSFGVYRPEGNVTPAGGIGYSFEDFPISFGP
jgi:hypothetical protein